MQTYTEFAAGHDGLFFWSCDAGPYEDGRQLADVLVYDTQADLDADDDNSLAVDRATVIDDRGDLAERIAKLRAEAAEHGDDAQVTLCGQALSGDAAAAHKCVRALANAAAQAE